MTDQKENTLKIFHQIDEVWAKVGESEDLKKALQNFDHIIERTLSVEMDNGETREFEAFRIQHSNARGPYKGGLRFHKDVDKETIQELSCEMSLKTAVVDIPVGGGKGGVKVDTKELSRAELERVSRAFVDAFYEHIGPAKDVPAPDVGTNPEVMGVMLDQYEKHTGENTPGVITGKPLALGGSQGRSYATAQGGVYALEGVLKKLSLSGEQTVSIQGFGNAGYHAARLLQEAGHSVISVSDSQGILKNKNGLDVEKVWSVKQEKGSVVKATDEGEVSEDECVEADIFIPAALSDSVSKDLAEKLQAKVVLELANGPLTDEADSVFEENDVVVIPDILANAGGVIVSYFEQVQNASNYYWKEKDVLEQLEERIRKATGDVWEVSQEHGVTQRQAALILALGRLAEAKKARTFSY